MIDDRPLAVALLGCTYILEEYTSLIFIGLFSHVGPPIMHSEILLTYSW